MRNKLLQLISTSALLGISLVSLTAATTSTFRQGVNGYTGTQDTFISSASPTTDRSSSATIEIDQEGDAGEFILMRFDNLFGNGPGQIPSKSKVLFATLTVTISNTGDTPALHQMLTPWQETDTWETLIDGVLADDVEAASVPDVTFPGNISPAIIQIPISTLQAWSDGTKTNHGWIFRPSGTDGTDFGSSEHGTEASRPLLTVSWSAVDGPFVKSVSPADGADNVPINANIAITIADGTLKLAPASVRLTVNSQPVTPQISKPAGATESIVTYDPPTDLSANVKTTIRVTFTDDATPPNSSSHEFSFTPSTIAVVVIDDKQMWRYDRSGMDLGTAWKEKNFNDSAWPQGAALIADETGPTVEPIRTPFSRIADDSNAIGTFYFRTHFNYDGPLGGDLLVRHVVDDGCVVYLNGVELHRFGFTAVPAGDPVTFDTFSTSNENAYRGPFRVSGASLVRGDNVLAVEVHQTDLSSSDVVFGADLMVSLSTPLIRIDAATMWRYDRSGTDLGTAWRAKTFNDAAWPQGAALIADETGTTAEQIRTPIDRFNDLGEPIATFYFRHRFNFTGDPKALLLQLRHVIDDGAIVYLNGVEVHRFGYASDVTVAFDNTAAAGHEGSVYEGPFQISPASLVVGENVVAVEVHQSGTGSSDMVFGLELIGYPLPPATPTESKFTAFTRSGNSLDLQWTGTGTLQSADAVTGPWTDVGGAKSPFAAPIAGTAKFYRLK